MSLLTIEKNNYPPNFKNALHITPDACVLLLTLTKFNIEKSIYPSTVYFEEWQIVLSMLISIELNTEIDGKRY